MAKSDAKKDWLNPSISIESNTDNLINDALVYGEDSATHMVRKSLMRQVGVRPVDHDQSIAARVVHVPPVSEGNKSYFSKIWPYSIPSTPELGKYPYVHVRIVKDSRDAFLLARPPDSNDSPSGKLYRLVSNPSGFEIGHGSEVKVVLSNPRMQFSTNPNIPVGTIVEVVSAMPQNLNGVQGNCNPRKPKSDGSKTVEEACKTVSRGPKSRNFISLPPPPVTAQIVYPTNPVAVGRANQAKAPDGTDILSPDEFMKKFVTSGIGARNTGLAGASTNHAGVDFRAPLGTPFYAALDGEVVRVRLQGSPSTKVGFGWYVVVRHDDYVTSYGGPFYTLYAHMNKPVVRVKNKVSQGQILGTSGNTGKSTGPHLHFEVWYDPKGNNKLGVKGQVIDSLEPISQFLFGPGFAIKGTTGSNAGGAYGGQSV